MPQREEMSGMEKIGKSLPIFRSDMLPGKLPDGDGVERFRIPQERSRSIGSCLLYTSIGRIFSAKSMSNVDALGTGPAVKVKIGKKIGYERDSFIRWLRGKMKHDTPHVKKRK